METIAATEAVLGLEQQLYERLGGRVRNLRVIRRDGQLVLEGSSHSFYAKQLATHALMEFDPAEELVNEIVVDRHA